GCATRRSAAARPSPASAPTAGTPGCASATAGPACIEAPPAARRIPLQVLMDQTVFPAPAPTRLPVRGSAARFPVHRIYCIGRNYADHAKEMGAAVDRGNPVFFMKPADAAVPGGGLLPYPRGTSDLHHEVELVVALGRDADGVVIGRAHV